MTWKNSKGNLSTSKTIFLTPSIKLSTITSKKATQDVSSSSTKTEKWGNSNFSNIPTSSSPTLLSTKSSWTTRYLRKWPGPNFHKNDIPSILSNSYFN